MSLEPPKYFDNTPTVTKTKIQLRSLQDAQFKILVNLPDTNIRNFFHSNFHNSNNPCTRIQTAHPFMLIRGSFIYEMQIQRSVEKFLNSKRSERKHWAHSCAGWYRGSRIPREQTKNLPTDQRRRVLINNWSNKPYIGWLLLIKMYCFLVNGC